jgi:UDP-GlcNAc:undecaprenyl-phosphate GlcNAc-1-phosphate transferase
MFYPYLFGFLVAFLTVVFITPLTITLLTHFGIVDDPTRHKHPGIIHTKITARGGGIVLFIGVITAGLFFLPLTQPIINIFFAAIIALFIGVYDDYLNARGKDLSPYIRFFGNILCASIIVFSGVRINFITNPLGGILHIDSLRLALPILEFFSLADAISIVWIVWVMNMLNWSKGVDGQMPGVVSISAIVIGIVSLRLSLGNSYVPDAFLAFTIAGSMLGFLLYNFYPAKIFPGYGATAIYLLLAVASILSGAKLATAMLVMGVPMVDAAFTILRRIASGKSPFWHDKLHLHHKLLQLGISQRKIALYYWAFSGILGSISLTLESKSKAFALVMLVVLVGGALLFLHFVLRPSNEKTIT